MAYVTVGRPSVRLSSRSTAATAAGGFAAEQGILIDSCGRRAAGAGAQQQTRPSSVALRGSTRELLRANEPVSEERGGSFQMVDRDVVR